LHGNRNLHIKIKRSPIKGSVIKDGSVKAFSHKGLRMSCSCLRIGKEGKVTFRRVISTELERHRIRKWKG